MWEGPGTDLTWRLSRERLVCLSFRDNSDFCVLVCSVKLGYPFKYFSLLILRGFTFLRVLQYRSTNYIVVSCLGLGLKETLNPESLHKNP